MYRRILAGIAVLLLLLCAGKPALAQEYGILLLSERGHDPANCSYDFFKGNHGNSSSGDFYFADGRFHADSAGQRGITMLGEGLLDIAALEFPAESDYSTEITIKRGQTYLARARQAGNHRFIYFRIHELVTSTVGSAEIMEFEQVQPITRKKTKETTTNERITGLNELILKLELRVVPEQAEQTTSVTAVVLEYYTLETGSIVVRTNHPDASYVIYGLRDSLPDYSGRGEEFTISRAHTGPYTVCFGPIDGYNQPPDRDIEVKQSEASIISATYEEKECDPKFPWASEGVLVAVIGGLSALLTAFVALRERK